MATLFIAERGGMGYGGAMLALLLALAPPGGFSCTVEGAKLLGPAMTPEAVCARVKAAVAKAGVRLDRASVRVAIRFEKPGIASARVTRIAGGRSFEWPEISIATSDRAMDGATVDQLAREVAGRLATK